MLNDAPITTILPCVDVDRAREFYSETLGLEEVRIPGDTQAEAQGRLMFESGQGTRIGLYQREKPPKADHTVAGWMVEDLDATVDDLLDRGVTFEVYDMPGVEFDERGVARADGMRSAWFEDPAGNTLSIMQKPSANR